MNAPISAALLRLVKISEHLRETTDGSLILEVPDSLDWRGRRIEYGLSDRTVRILQNYLQSYYPASEGTPWLFPSRLGNPKNDSLFSRQIKDEILFLTGLNISTRDFRHIAAKLFLDRNPGAFEVVRRLLGQKLLKSTLQNYRDFEMINNATVLEEIVIGPKAEA